MLKKCVFKVGLKTVIFSIFTGFCAKNDIYHGKTYNLQRFEAKLVSFLPIRVTFVDFRL
jgi:hypothetical protein